MGNPRVVLLTNVPTEGSKTPTGIGAVISSRVKPASRIKHSQDDSKGAQEFQQCHPYYHYELGKKAIAT